MEPGVDRRECRRTGDTTCNRATGRAGTCALSQTARRTVERGGLTEIAKRASSSDGSVDDRGRARSHTVGVADACNRHRLKQFLGCVRIVVLDWLCSGFWRQLYDLSSFQLWRFSLLGRLRSDRFGRHELRSERCRQTFSVDASGWQVNQVAADTFLGMSWPAREHLCRGRAQADPMNCTGRCGIRRASASSSSTSARTRASTS